MEIYEELASTVEAGDALLFAGAGCSALIKIPVWRQYLESLAEQAGRFELETAALMRKRIAAGGYLAAATLFKRILQAPPGEVHAALSRPFTPGTYDFTPLLPLASMPFSGIVTTNYDSSLFEARMQIAAPLRANITETLLVLLIKEQGGKEIQHEEREGILSGPGCSAQ